MPRNPLDGLPEVFLSTTELSTAVSRAVSNGTLRRIGSKLYTFNMADPPEQIVRRHLWQLVAAHVPDALIADRTAIENQPAADGSIFVISDRKRAIELPGIAIRPLPGPGPLDDTDRRFVDGLFLSSTARAYLDNMAPSRRRRGDISREAKASLTHWQNVAKAASWTNVTEVEQSFSKAKALNGERVRFEVAGGQLPYDCGVRFYSRDCVHQICLARMRSMTGSTR